jgi:acyl carrier protein
MNTDIETVFLEELGRIAPEADIARLDRRADLREALDIDSMDLLNLLVALHERLGIDIPERDAGRLATVDGAVAYLVERAGGAG